MEKDNVYVLFEEIKNKIDMINGKLDRVLHMFASH